jgi:hypothetical protein
MSFVFPKGGRTFFKAIEAPRDGAKKFLMFDAFYCCLLAGFDARRLGVEGDLESDVFLNGYPEDYKGQADIIAGLLIDAELDLKAIDSDDKTSIEHEMIKLINPTSATRLSDDGSQLLNLYAAHGFKLLQDYMMPPATVEEFLVAFHGYWHQESAAA